MIHLPAVVMAAGLVVGAFCSDSAVAAPISAGGIVPATAGAELAQWHGSRSRHARGRCWWEHRRVRDHRGRWVMRRVQVCPR